MKTEIKFRMWDKIANRFFTDPREVMECLTQQMTGVFDHISNGSIFEQFTGLKDKNGVAIFEGDIVTSTEYPYQNDGEYNYHGVVGPLEDGSFWLTKRAVNPIIRGISDGMSEEIGNHALTDFEVIGNIHENAELLERFEA